MIIVLAKNLRSNEMIDLIDSTGSVFATTHIDLFWEKGCTSNPESLFSKLQSGRELKVELKEV